MYTEYKYNPAQADVDNIVNDIERNNPGTNPVKYAADVISRNLATTPSYYLRYGPWWWSVKQVLRTHGILTGKEDDAIMRKEYGFKDEMKTILAAEQFRREYLANMFDCTREFILDGEGSVYVLTDSDME